jgi:hypothetical protein
VIIQTSQAVQEVITISLTPNEAYSLWLAIEPDKNKVASTVNDRLFQYTKAKGLHR